MFSWFLTRLFEARNFPWPLKGRSIGVIVIFGSIFGFVIFDGLTDLIVMADNSNQRLANYQQNTSFFAGLLHGLSHQLQQLPMLHQVAHWLHDHPSSLTAPVSQPPLIDPKGWVYWFGVRSHTLTVLELLAEAWAGLTAIVILVLGYLGLALVELVAGIQWVIDFLRNLISYLLSLKSLHQLGQDTFSNVYVDTPRQVAGLVRGLCELIWVVLGPVLSWCYEPLFTAGRIFWQLLKLTNSHTYLVGNLALSVIPVVVLACQCTKFTLGLFTLVPASLMHLNGISSRLLFRRWHQPFDLAVWLGDVLVVMVAGVVCGLYGSELIGWACQGFPLFYDSINIGLMTPVNSLELGFGELLFNLGIIRTTNYLVNRFLFRPNRSYQLQEAY